ncbi:MAG: SusC/RagA family TonB-linked outer membrane protein [Candidatus Cryptobacteroides sp.]
MTLLLSLSCFSAAAQGRTVTGKVVDAAGEALMGVAVIQQGTNNGTVTELDGSFALQVPAADVVLEITSLGYVPKAVSVPTGTKTVTVVLSEDTTVLEETVVVGYGTQKKVNLTGAVTAVESKELEDRTAHNLSTMLQGAVAGFNISTSSGNPGSTGTLNIRGYTSINNAGPLVLIDGVPGDIDRVNPADVASISVIKDASAAAVYGARGAYGVVLVTTKDAKRDDGKATVRYSGRWGWEEPTTSTDYETRGYWSVYTVDKFWMADSGTKYTTYTDEDMIQLLARINDVTENPERPWIVEDFRKGRNQWVYYCNTDWYHELYNDQHPVTSHTVSISGGNKDVKYYISGGYDRQTGVVKVNPDVFQKYNLRSKLDFKINKYARLSNNTSFYASTYDWVGAGDVEDSFAYASRHALASFPLKNPDGTWTYGTPMISGGYNIANGRHIIFGDGIDKNTKNRTDFSNTTQLTIKPVKQLSLVANYTYRLYQNRDSGRLYPMTYRRYPDSALESYSSGAGLNSLTESVTTYNRQSANIFATYEDTFADAHHLTLTAGMNAETYHKKSISATGQNISTPYLNDLNLIGTDENGEVVTSASGGATSNALLGFFARANYDYKGRYLLEVSGRYDGSSRFAPGHRWGFFPSASAGWRISEEPFFEDVKNTVNNLKLRASFGRLGNQEVSDFSYLQEVSFYNFNTSGHYYYTFGESTINGKYASLSAPVNSNLTWETAEQIDLGVDVALFGNRLEFTGDVYVRNTLNMLVKGTKIPALYGADAPKENSADLSTKGYELALSWKDSFELAGERFGYSIRGTLSDYATYVTRYANNPDKILSDYYEGQRIGDIWGFRVDGFFATDEEAIDYNTNVCDQLSYIGTSRMRGGVMAGDLKYLDLNDDQLLSIGSNTVENPGDREILGNSLASLQYGFTFAFDYMGFDASIFFQGTGDHYWYPSGMNMSFWGPYSYSYTSFIPRDFYTTMCWSEDNPDAYFPRPRAYSSTGGQLRLINDRYLQNIRYLRLKNLTLGYTIPKNITKVLSLQKVRVYFSGENLHYWSPLTKVTKYLDPEAAFRRYTSENNARDHMFYPWQKTYMFGIDITF